MTDQKKRELQMQLLETNIEQIEQQIEQLRFTLKTAEDTVALLKARLESLKCPA